MIVRIETHCHSCYSHDSGLSVDNIAKAAKKTGLTHILVCDHDRYGMSPVDKDLFLSYGIKLVNGIEFTTKEGVHIIGVHDDIHTIERPAHTYTIRELMDELGIIGAISIIPHPEHETGIIGNKKVLPDDADYAFSKAQFLEISNYKYGECCYRNITNKYPHLKLLIGSDAHSLKSVAAYYNEFELSYESSNPLEKIIGSDAFIKHIYSKQHSGLFFIKKKIKRTMVYQCIMHIIPSNLRRKIKNKFLNI